MKSSTYSSEVGFFCAKKNSFKHPIIYLYSFLLIELELRIEQKKNPSNFKDYNYWEVKKIANKGLFATNGLPYENQAFFDFNGIALPIFDEMNDY